MTTVDPMRAKALAVIREGRLVVRHAQSAEVAGAPTVIEALGVVRSSRPGGPTYAVDKLDGAFTCTCRAGGDCAHAFALQLVTGGAT